MEPDDHLEWNADSSDWGGEEGDVETEPVGTVAIATQGDLYVAEDETTGISSQGATMAEALRNLAANLEVYEEGEASSDDWF